MRKMLLGLISLCVVASAELPSLAAQKDDAGPLLHARSAGRGVFVLLGDKDCGTALRLAADNRLTIYVQLRSAKEVAAARRAAAAAGLYGTRIFVEKGEPERVHLADNIADWLVAMGDSAGVPSAEVLRVLRPGGGALVRQKELVKPMPEGVSRPRQQPAVEGPPRPRPIPYPVHRRAPLRGLPPERRGFGRARLHGVRARRLAPAGGAHAQHPIRDERLQRHRAVEAAAEVRDHG